MFWEGICETSKNKKRPLYHHATSIRDGIGVVVCVCVGGDGVGKKERACERLIKQRRLSAHSFSYKKGGGMILTTRKHNFYSW